MALYPEARAAVTAAASEMPVWTPGYDVAAAREENLAAARAEEREEVAEARDLDADGVRVRLYRPDPVEPGVVVHLHGGGFVFHDVEVHDAACRRLSNRIGMAVASVDYRCAPEHRFPAAPDDVDTALAWLEREAENLGIAGPTYAHGESAGGNLAVVAALRNPGRFRALALIYPFLDPSASFASYKEAAAAGFDPREASWYWDQYARGPEDLTDPDFAPLQSDRLATLPPTFVATAEHDPLRDEGEHLAALLAEAGVHVVAARYLGQIHGFWRHHAVFPSAESLLWQTAGFLATQR